MNIISLAANLSTRLNFIFLTLSIYDIFLCSNSAVASFFVRAVHQAELDRLTFGRMEQRDTNLWTLFIDSSLAVIFQNMIKTTNLPSFLGCSAP